MAKNKNYEYDVKCRGCAKITRMHFGSSETIEPKNFIHWAIEHSTFPIQKQCVCDNGMMMFHDIVSFGNLLKIL